jgi:LPXTG-motif cell wall-anchored protein
MSSFNVYPAFAEESDEAEEELVEESEPEVMPEAEEIPEEVVLPEELVFPEADEDPGVEAVAEDSDEEDVNETNEKSDNKSDEEAVKEIKEEEEKIEATEDDPEATDKPGKANGDGLKIEDSTEEAEDVLVGGIPSDALIGNDDGYCMWYIDPSWTLHIRHSDYSDSSDAYVNLTTYGYYSDVRYSVPWGNYGPYAEKIVIEDTLHFGTGSAAYLFYNTPDVTEIEGLEKLDMSSAVDTQCMFNQCGVRSLDVSGWDVSNVTNMSYMFSSATKLTSLDLSNWDTSNVTDMSGMFYNDELLQSVKMPRNTGNVTTMYNMFAECDSLTDPGVSNLDTSSVTSMSRMFMNCFKLTELDLSSFDTSNVTSISKMFAMDYPTNLEKVILGPKVDSHFKNCALWDGASGVYVSNNGEGPSDSNYVGRPDDLYAYQADESNRTGNNTYRLCDVISYDPNGGTWSDGSDTVKLTYVAVGERWDMITEQPTKSGENFVGWDRFRDETGSLYDLKTSFVSSGWEYYTFYADWGGKDRIAYDTLNDSVNGAIFATVDVSGSNAPAFTCEFSIKALDYAPAPTNSTASVSFSGEGSQVIDFGTITFMRTGTYRYEITQSSADTDGWVHNNGKKIVTVTVSSNEAGEAYISSLNGVEFRNCYMGSILTKDLTEAYKADATQRNHQQSTADEEALYKSAQWTNKSNGEGQIDIVYNNTYSDSSSTTAVYIFTNCTAHGFSADLAKKNIKFLLGYYDTVVAVCSMKTKRSTDSDVSYEKFVFKSSDGDDEINNQLSQYLSNINFDIDMHLSAVGQLACFDACLDQFDPDAVFFSYDGGRGFDYANDMIAQGIFGMSKELFDQSEFPEPVLKHYDKTLQKLAELMKKREFYIMIAEGSNSYSDVSKDYDTLATSSRELKNLAYLAMMTIDPVTMSTAEGRDEIKEAINSTDDGINLRNYVNENLLMTYGTEVYSYSQEMEKTLTMKVGEKYSVTDVVEPRFSISGDITVTVPIKDSEGKYKVLTKDEDYTLTIADDADSGGKKVTVNFLKWDGYPAKITIPITLKDISKGFFDSNDWFDNTNVGDAYATVTDVIYNGTTQQEEDQTPVQSIKVSPPQLYLSNVPDLPILPTAGGDGMGIYTVFGAALVLAGLSVLRAKRRYEHKK